MKLIRQTRKGECGPACVATVAGVSLEKALELLGDPSLGITSEQMIEALLHLGVPSLESLVWPSYRVPVIATVPSLNYPGLNHFIVWTGEKWLDPSDAEKIYPEHSPIVQDGVLGPQWSAVILLWPGGGR